MRPRCGAADHDHVAQVAQAFSWNRLKLRQQRLTDDHDPRARVVQDVLVVVGLEQRAGRNRHRADLDRAEEAGDILRAVEQQEQHAFFDAHAERIAQGIAEAIDAVEHLAVGDARVARVHLDRDALAAALGHVAIDEIGGHVELIWNRRRPERGWINVRDCHRRAYLP